MVGETWCTILLWADLDLEERAAAFPFLEEALEEAEEEVRPERASRSAPASSSPDSTMAENSAMASSSRTGSMESPPARSSSIGMSPKLLVRARARRLLRGIAQTLICWLESREIEERGLEGGK